MKTFIYCAGLLIAAILLNISLLLLLDYSLQSTHAVSADILYNSFCWGVFAIWAFMGLVMMTVVFNFMVDDH